MFAKVTVDHVLGRDKATRSIKKQLTMNQPVSSHKKRHDGPLPRHFDTWNKQNKPKRRDIQQNIVQNKKNTAKTAQCSTNGLSSTHLSAQNVSNLIECVPLKHSQRSRLLFVHLGWQEIGPVGYVISATQRRLLLSHVHLHVREEVHIVPASTAKRAYREVRHTHSSSFQCRS